jgi:hypothetical protein
VPSRGTLAGAALAALLAACSQAPKPQPVSAAKPEAPAAQPAAAASPAPEKPATAAPNDGGGTSVVVIDPGEEENGPKSLVEAARAERQRKAHASGPVAVITNKTLSHSSGQLTQAQPAPGAKKGKEAAAKAAAKPAVHDEAYWRQHGLDIRVRWRKASEDVERLEKEAAELRRRFYAQNDPAVRDAQIKPEWDRTLELLDKARLDVKAAQAELAAFMEEGRRAGALPGWLREGAETEPEKKPAPASPTESIEPPVLPEGPPADAPPAGGSPGSPP